MSVNIKIGDTKVYLIVFRDNNEHRVDISGRVFTAQLRRSKSTAVALADFDCEITDAVNGELTLTLTSEQTNALSPGRAIWDIRETYGDAVNTLTIVTVQIERGVTRDE
jgi:hypothetical protein